MEKIFKTFLTQENFDPLTLDDARVAVGGTRDALVEVLTQHYLPIADRYLAPAD